MADPSTLLFVKLRKLSGRAPPRSGGGVLRSRLNPRGLALAGVASGACPQPCPEHRRRGSRRMSLGHRPGLLTAVGWSERPGDDKKPAPVGKQAFFFTITNTRILPTPYK